MKSMNTFVAIAAASFLLSACGSDSSPAKIAEEHEHALLISQANTDYLSVLEEGEAESLAESALGNAAELLLADNGELAAAVKGGAIEFVDGHHEELITIDNLDSGVTKVINSNGHFSVLVDGTTQFVPYEALEEENPAVETVEYSLTETYPALLLHEDETHGLLTLTFAGGNAVVYEGSTASADAAHTVNCAAVTSTAQYGEFALVSCGTDNYSVHVEGEAVEITALTAITAAVDWKVRAGVFVGLGDDEFYIREIDGENLVVEGPFAATENSAELCTWGIDSSAADIFALTTTELAVYDHEGAKQTPSALLEKTTTTDCTDLKLATANKAAFVLDNQSQTLYEIDKEAVVYHVHGTETLSVNDVVSAVSFHEIDSEGSHEDH